MRNIHYAFFSLLLLLLVGCSHEQQETAANNAEQMHGEQRLIATTAAVTNILDALELDLIGVPTTTQPLPVRYEGVTEVGNPMSPNMEMIASLKPTEVFSVTTLEYDLTEAFKQLNIPATYINLQGIQPMMDSILSIGKRYNREAQAQHIIDEMNAQIERLQQSFKGQDKPSVLILLGIPGSYLVATENSYIGDLVRLAGGENIAAGQAAEYLPSNTEFLHESNPDVILRLAHGMPEQVVKMFDEEFKTNDIWKHFSAVQNNRVYDLEEPLFGTTATIEVTTALEQLIDILHASEVIQHD